MKANVTCRNEALEIPLWDNKIITGSEKVLDSKILKPCGLVILEDVIKKGNLISFQELAVKCNIKAINAGKIMSGLKKKHVCSNFVSETREGPACHVSSMLYLNDFDQECVPLSDMSVKQTYQTMIRKKFIVPVAEKVWPVKLNICPNAVDWGEIWKKTNTKSIDYEDRDLWFRLRHRILPVNDKLQKMNKVDEIKCGICKQEDETIEHLFIYCKTTWPAWLFIENVIRKYKNNRFFCLNDSSRILGYGRNICAMTLFLIAKLHRTIWVSRCHNLKEKYSVKEITILKAYQTNLKRVITLEKRDSPVMNLLLPSPKIMRCVMLWIISLFFPSDTSVPSGSGCPLVPIGF